MRFWNRYGGAIIPALSVATGLALWGWMSTQVNPAFLPSPLATWRATVELWNDGTLVSSVLVSSGRILAGWIAGLAVGIPLGILMGCFRPVRQWFEPYIEFFRFVPPIAFVTLTIIWLGPGEASKIALIFYTTVFIVVLNAIAGVVSVNPIRLQAAAALGAGPWQRITTVIVPSTVPYIVTGARIAMGNSFLTIVSAEIVAARTGIGAMIWSARNFGRIEWVFTGIIILGLTGFLFDRIIRFVATRRRLSRYGPAL